MVKRCEWGNCKSDSRYPNRLSGGIFFIPFPKPRRNLAKCERWIQACGRTEGVLTLEKINSHRYVCSQHFIGQMGPTPNHPDPLPYIIAGANIRNYDRREYAQRGIGREELIRQIRRKACANSFYVRKVAPKLGIITVEMDSDDENVQVHGDAQDPQASTSDQHTGMQTRPLNPWPGRCFCLCSLHLKYSDPEAYSELTDFRDCKCPPHDTVDAMGRTIRCKCPSHDRWPVGLKTCVDHVLAVDPVWHKAGDDEGSGKGRTGAESETAEEDNNDEQPSDGANDTQVERSDRESEEIISSDNDNDSDVQEAANRKKRGATQRSRHMQRETVSDEQNGVADGHVSESLSPGQEQPSTSVSKPKKKKPKSGESPAPITTSDPSSNVSRQQKIFTPPPKQSKQPSHPAKAPRSQQQEQQQTKEKQRTRAERDKSANRSSNAASNDVIDEYDIDGGKPDAVSRKPKTRKTVHHDDFPDEDGSYECDEPRSTKRTRKVSEGSSRGKGKGVGKGKSSSTSKPKAKPSRRH